MKILLKYLKKQKGGRMTNIDTYKAYCNSKKKIRPDAWLIINETLKLPESSDIFGHVALAELQDQTIVVKVFDAGDNMLKKELSMLRFLTNKNKNNIVKYICNIGCQDSRVRWENHITKSQICKQGSDDLQFVLMEYIHNGDLEEYLNSDRCTNECLKSILKQICLCLLDIYFNHRIVHGDIHRGNILISHDAIPETLEYKFGSMKISVESNGVEPIFIDFGRSYRVEKPSSSNSNDSIDMYGYHINYGVEDVLLVYNIIQVILSNREQKKYVKRIYSKLQGMKFDSTQTLQAVQLISEI